MMASTACIITAASETIHYVTTAAIVSELDIDLSIRLKCLESSLEIGERVDCVRSLVHLHLGEVS